MNGATVRGVGCPLLAGAGAAAAAAGTRRSRQHARSGGGLRCDGLLPSSVPSLRSPRPVFSCAVQRLAGFTPPSGRRHTCLVARAMATQERRGNRVESENARDPRASDEPQASDPEVEVEDAAGLTSQLLAAGGVAGGLVLVAAATTVFGDDIRNGLNYFTTIVDDWGALGYAAYMLLYTLLEVLAVPAIPLTMTAGVLFGSVAGTAMVSVCATAAATISFIISRYLARDKVLAWAKGNKKFAAIDAAIGREGLKVVILLRLSPLLPLAASNYLYGLTSVSLRDYAIGSWLGMLPGTIAYVSFGDVSKTVISGQEGGLGVSWWQGGLALGVTALAVSFVGNVAGKALADIEATVDE